MSIRQQWFLTNSYLDGDYIEKDNEMNAFAASRTEERKQAI